MTYIVVPITNVHVQNDYNFVHLHNVPHSIIRVNNTIFVYCKMGVATAVCTHLPLYKTGVSMGTGSGKPRIGCV